MLHGQCEEVSIDDLVVVSGSGYLDFSSGLSSPQDGGFDLTERELSVRQPQASAGPESPRAEAVEILDEKAMGITGCRRDSYHSWDHPCTGRIAESSIMLNG